MIRYDQLGQPFHGEMSSADASALSESASRVALYGPGSTTAVTLASGDQVVITDISIVVGAALTVRVYDGADATVDAGEVIARGAFPANGGQTATSGVGHFCQRGTWPKVKTSGAGQVDVVLRGVIIRG